MKKSFFIALTLASYLISYSQFATSIGDGDRGNFGDRPGSIGRDAVSRDAPSGARDQRGNTGSNNAAAQNSNGGKGVGSNPSLSSMFGDKPISGGGLSNGSNVS